MTKKRMKTDMRPAAAHYVELLSEEGYRPKIDERDDGGSVIRFKAEGTDFRLFTYGDDEAFFHLACGYRLGDADIALAINRAHELTANLKAAKVTVHPDDGSVRFAIEGFIDPPASFAIIERSIGVLRLAAKEFFEAPKVAAEQLDA